MDQIWTTVATGVQGILEFVMGVYGRGALVSGLLSLSIWACLEYVLGPIFRLPGLRMAYPMYAALRPLVATVTAAVCLYHLHRTGTLDFGVGPSGWLTAIIYGVVGGAMAPILHDFIKRRAPDVTLSPGPPAPPEPAP